MHIHIGKSYLIPEEDSEVCLRCVQCGGTGRAACWRQRSRLSNVGANTSRKAPDRRRLNRRKTGGRSRGSGRPSEGEPPLDKPRSVHPVLFG